MSSERLQEIIDELVQELAQSETPNEEADAALAKLRTGIESLSASSQMQENDSLLDDAIALEARFAASHPVAEKLLREFIENLSRLGI